LITNLGNGVWLVKLNLVVHQNTQLRLTNETMTELRLESTVVGSTKQFTRVVADGGHIFIQGIKVHSWNTPANRVDTDVENGRSYLTALRGARMDILNSEVSYLGWREPNPNFPGSMIGKGEPSGISWKNRADPNRPETGPRGSIIDSLIHHNYYGNYTYEAMDMVLHGNKVYENSYYGFDPHDYSNNFIITNNEFYNNPAHGLILSRGCVNAVISNNKFYNNGKHGLMLDRGTDNNQVFDNESYGNGEDGIVLAQSSGNIVRNNLVYNNRRDGIRIHAEFNSGDRYDGLAIDNRVLNNTVRANTRYGLTLYERGDRNLIRGNLIENNGSYGIYLRTGRNKLLNNTIRNNQREGIYVAGVAAYIAGTVPAVGASGQANRVEGNRLESNRRNGITIKDYSANSVLTGNTILSNLYNGVYVYGANALRNRVSVNQISANTRLGIDLSTGGNGNMPRPVIKGLTGGVLNGTGQANARIEIYRDSGGEGNVYLGQTTVGSNGRWTFTLPAGDNPAQGALTAIAIAANNNTSEFSTAFAGVVAAGGDEAAEEDAVDAAEAAEQAALTAAELAEDRAASAADRETVIESPLPETLLYLEQLEQQGEQQLQHRAFLPLTVR
jgi:parallel beta-helix repeat protein